MQLTEPEVDFLFSDTPLLGVASIALLVGFAVGYKPAENELVLLGNIISKGYGCSRSAVHFFYQFQSREETRFQSILEQLQPDLVLVFDPAVAALDRLVVGEAELVMLPDLHKIEGNLALKKELWYILKELKGR